MSRQRPCCMPIRSRGPTTRKPAARCSAMLAVFSGKIPDWIVQIPAASVEAMRRSSRSRPMPRAARVWVHVDGMLDHSRVDGPAGGRRNGHPAEHGAAGVEGYQPVVSQPGRAELGPARCPRLEGRVALVDACLVDRQHLPRMLGSRQASEACRCP